MKRTLPWAGILTGPHLLLDHLGVLCELLGIPLIVVDAKCCNYAERFYPNLEILFCNPLQIYALAAKFEVIIATGMCWQEEFSPLMEMLYGRAPRVIFAPHGHSEKGHSLSGSHYPAQDICLVYGQQMRDLLARSGATQQMRHLLVTGNYRLPYYQIQAQLQNRYFIQFLGREFSDQQTTLLYAPTWESLETPSSFFCACQALIEQKPSHLQLLIKLHPHLGEHFPVQTARVLSRYRDLPGVYFIDDFPLIFAVLAHVDLYLGDFSSIGYDFLFFDRPLFFYNPQPERLTFARGAALHRCGLTIPRAAYRNPYPFIEQHRRENQIDYRQLRQQTWQYAFGREKPVEQLKGELLEIVEGKVR